MNTFFHSDLSTSGHLQATVQMSGKLIYAKFGIRFTKNRQNHSIRLKLTRMFRLKIA